MRKTEFSVYIWDPESIKSAVGVIYGYMALFQIFAMFLAFGTRKVKVKGLNDSLYIAAIIYITSILLVVIIVVSLLLNSKLNTFIAVLNASIFISTTVILGLVFIPKVWVMLTLVVTSEILYSWGTIKNWLQWPQVLPLVQQQYPLVTKKRLN